MVELTLLSEPVELSLAVVGKRRARWRVRLDCSPAGRPLVTLLHDSYYGTAMAQAFSDYCTRKTKRSSRVPKQTECQSATGTHGTESVRVPE
jgi:hypothetical protein